MDVGPLKRFASRLARRMEMTQGFTIVLVSDAAMRRMNRRFAGKDRPTDVLSFPDQPDAGEAGDEPYAGDLLISAETANRQRKATLDEELQGLALHGVLHLLGYDHETDTGEMASLEGQLKKEFGLR